MAWTVVWLPEAEQELAELWLAASKRENVRAAADVIDAHLRRDPEHVGEERSGSRRIVIVPPLAATYRVATDDRLVQVSNVRKLPQKPQNG